MKSNQPDHYSNIQISFERSAEQSALLLFQEIFSDLQLAYEHNVTFTLPINSWQTIETVECWLVRNGHQQFFAGATHQVPNALVAALAELLEYYFISEYAIAASALPLGEWEALNTFQSIGWLGRPAEQDLQQTVHLQTYINLDGTQSLSYPFELRADKLTGIPAIDHYAHFTGLGFGQNKPEAILHAIHEWTERDAYSSFLINTFLNKQPYHVVDYSSLPDELYSMLVAINTAVDDELLLINITNDIGIAAFLVMSQRQDFIIQALGLGASLNAECALKHAIEECLQHITRRTENTAQFWRDAQAYYQDKPLAITLMKCALEDKPYSTQSFKTIQSVRALSLSEQVDLCQVRYQARGFEIYQHDLYQHANGACLSSVIIPGLQNFFLIKQAKFMPLTPRSKTLLASRPR